MSGKLNIEVEIIADSINVVGDRLTTMRCKYPNIIHNQVLTHRDFNRNAASMRAIPGTKFCDEVERNPYIPPVFGKNAKGMQSYEELPEDVSAEARAVWEDCLNYCLQGARKLHALQVTKQTANRLLMPFFYTETLITATNWGNFFAVRFHKDPQPEMVTLAEMMLRAYKSNIPTPVHDGDCHAPYVIESDMEVREAFESVSGDKSQARFNYFKMSVSANRCKRISTVKLEKRLTLVEEYTEAQNAFVEGHFSPFEHQGVPVRASVLHSLNAPAHSGNFVGFLQFRKLLPVTEFGFDYDTETRYPK